ESVGDQEREGEPRKRRRLESIRADLARCREGMLVVALITASLVASPSKGAKPPVQQASVSSKPTVALVELKGLVAASDLVGVDVNGMRERGRAKVVVPGVDDADGRALALESALTGILRPEAWQGTLRIDVAQRGASIYVDAAPRGFAPISEPLELTPGA